jgi:hypothetical protein
MRVIGKEPAITPHCIKGNVSKFVASEGASPVG